MLNIAIAGAGIGGLAAATLLARDGHRVTVFDQFDEPRPVGSGLILNPVGLAALDLIGAAETALALGARITHLQGRETVKHRKILDVSFQRRGQGFGLAIHRASLFAALWQTATEAGASIRPASKVLGSATAPDGRHIMTTSGPHGPFDLLIDAMGVNSTLAQMKVRPLPYGAIWGTVPWPATTLPTDRLTQRYRRADHMAGVLPIGGLPDDPTPLATIFWSLPRSELADWAGTDIALWKAKAAAFWPDFAPFLDSIQTADQLNIATYAHGTLKQPYAERLAFIGDAAHRTSPQLGQGANMALLDALALTQALFEHKLPDALTAYARMRRWHVRLYQALSAAFTPQYQSGSQVLPVLRDHILAPLSFTWPMPSILNRLISGDLIPPLAGQSFP